MDEKGTGRATKGGGSGGVKGSRSVSGGGSRGVKGGRSGAGGGVERGGSGGERKRRAALTIEGAECGVSIVEGKGEERRESEGRVVRESRNGKERRGVMKENEVKELTEKDIVSVAELAYLCGIGERQVQNLASDGVFVKDGRGRYKRAESLKNYIELQKKNENTVGIDMDDEAARIARAKREVEEVRAALVSGRVMEVEAVMFVVGENFALIRNRLLSLPDRLIPSIVPAHEVVQAKETATKMIREILSELSVSGDEIAQQTDFKRVFAPVKPCDISA